MSLQQMLHVNTFKIGADPEFGVRDKVTKNGVIATQHASLSTNEIGYDHGGHVVELRPKPAYRVQEFLKNIKDLLKKDALAPLKKYEWKGGGCFRNIDGHLQAIGGHIHLELPYLGHHGIEESVYKLRVKACDVVTKHLEDLNILPAEESRIRRSAEAGGWGRFGAVQAACSPQSYGQPFYRMEYRTPCSWLFDPKVAFVTITGIKLAATMPELAISTLNGETDGERWASLVKFFRTFRAIDSDAEFVCKRLLKSSNPKCLKALQVNPDCDFRVRWDKFKYV
jgi:hypothetical protein